MANVLIVAEQSADTSRRHLHAIAAGQALANRTGGAVHVAVLGKGIGRWRRARGTG